MERHWHAMTIPAVLEAVGSSPDGLGSREVAARQRRGEPNELREAPPESPSRLLVRQFSDFMVLVLLGATGVALLLGERGDALTIVVIVVINACLGFAQEYRAERSLLSLRRLAAPTARVLRDGRARVVPSRDVVVGDVLLLEAGDRVSADARLLHSVQLEVEESALTGESMPTARDARAPVSADAPLPERVNMLFSATTVTRGRGVAVVVATGMGTEVGAIAGLIQAAHPDPTPLQRRLQSLGRTLVIACLVICAVVVAAGVLRGEPPYRMFLVGVSLAVAAIPEGLPAIVTIALAVGVQRMIRRRAVVRRLPAVETLGCATVIASDKTGTLTANAMSLDRVWTLDGGYRVEEGGFVAPEASGDASGVSAAVAADLTRLVVMAALCSNASLVPAGQGEPKRWEVTGDPTEGALLVAAAGLGLTPDRLALAYRRIAEEPFTAEARRMAVAVACPDGSELAIMKGAVEAVLPACASVRAGGRAEPLTAGGEGRVVSAARALSADALRVLAVALRSDGRLGAPGGWCLLGLAGIWDPPRPEARPAVARVRAAGIRPVMITGDHPVTAAAVARMVGILDAGGEVASGPQLEALDEADLVHRVRGTDVFARVSPTLKLRLVRALRKSGEVVAMTGDGVNDAPALREADIGIAMGIMGTDVTKEASSMVLSDDNFATIVAAVEEGRAIYDNIRKFVRYLLACNVGEVLLMFLASILGAPMPLIPIQILWVNLVTDGLPAMALGVDPVDPDAMTRPPRDPGESIFARHLGFKIVSRGVLIAVSSLGIFLVYLAMGAGLTRGRTVAFATLIGCQLFHVFDCRSETKTLLEMGLGRNRFLVAAVLSSVLLMLAVIYLPGLRATFHTWPLGAGDWLAVAAVSGAGSFGVMVRRSLWRRRFFRQTGVARAGPA